MQLTRCHESQLKPDFQKPCYSIQLMDNYHIQKLGGLLTQYARDTRLYPAFRVRVWPWKTTQIRGGKYMDFVFFYGTSCVTLELITRLWMSSERNSLLYCNWCMAHDGWLLLYLVPVSSCNLFIWWDCVTEAGFVVNTSEGCYRCTLRKSEWCDCHATKELCQMADFNTICRKVCLHSCTTVTQSLAVLSGL